MRRSCQQEVRVDSPRTATVAALDVHPGGIEASSSILTMFLRPNVGGAESNAYLLSSISNLNVV
jgi:hypothetical protein